MSSRLWSRPIGDCPAFERFAEALSAWLDADENAASPPYDGMVALCAHVRANAIAPEHLLAALQVVEVTPLVDRTVAIDRLRARGDRYVAALRMLMPMCYGYEPLLRLVHGPDGRGWVVMHIREGMRWDPEIEMRRQDWLCCATRDDRRYITPVPPTWHQWSDVELLGAVLRAKPDLRGPD